MKITGKENILEIARYWDRVQNEISKIEVEIEKRKWGVRNHNWKYTKLKLGDATFEIVGCPLCKDISFSSDCECEAKRKLLEAELKGLNFVLNAKGVQDE